MIQTGLLSERITLQSKSVTRDVMGGEVITWVNQAEVWASAQPLRGREFFAAQQVQAEISIRFRLRYRSDITSAWRVKWREQQYEIIAPPIDVDARKIDLELMCATAQN